MHPQPHALAALSTSPGASSWTASRTHSDASSKRLSARTRARTQSAHTVHIDASRRAVHTRHAPRQLCCAVRGSAGTCGAGTRSVGLPSPRRRSSRSCHRGSRRGGSRRGAAHRAEEQRIALRRSASRRSAPRRSAPNNAARTGQVGQPNVSLRAHAINHMQQNVEGDQRAGDRIIRAGWLEQFAPRHRIGRLIARRSCWHIIIESLAP